ncbi:hypothetical protein GCM10011506_33730 [Marivirga lumbricoides]|uniref:Uncharacterized protein n=1 Tax=Marivirga lumbricoides TaxID=1046115 RepID=A0A2T4DPC9_9BACT|nr:hypothetical protein C9994_10805 [Marivirga lumbricoides]GGC45384.1 hypothetical protein GCM10011506_33730 [Marivirga lumbricoides]
MQIKYTNSFLNKLEDVFSESDYILRYEKGNFKSGYCVLKDQKIVIINKFFDTEGKINCLVDLVKNLDLDVKAFSDKNRSFYLELKQTQLAL